jgi:hypothetical protein
MTDFGDIEPSDVVDTEPPDPVALARLLHKKLREITGDPNRKLFDDLEPLEQWILIIAFRHIIEKLTREWQKAPI